MRNPLMGLTSCLASCLPGRLRSNPWLPRPASVAGKTLADSKHQWRKAENHLPDDAPNIVIFMTDDAGFANSSTFGGPVNTPTLDRLANSGISYNRFHTTAQCTATRASLLTGRNHHRVGAGQIAEFASDWDGYAGVIPKTTATIPQVLSHYGYNTAAFGKWRNTPVTSITKPGPFDRWPTGMGWIPRNAKLNPLHEGMQKWSDVPNSQKEFQIRLMEIFAGFLEHTDVQYGKIVDELEAQGIPENTIIIYINSDNGPSAEGLNGSISELSGPNVMPSTIEQQIEVLNRDYGGLDALGGPKLESMYHHGWTYAGAAPFQGVKLLAAYMGGTRTPLVISWPAEMRMERSVPAVRTASVALDYYDRAQFAFNGTIEKTHTKYIN